jgi:hypothetical protein
MTTLRRLSVQIPKDEQPDFLAATFDVEVLRKSLAIAVAAQQSVQICTCRPDKAQPEIRCSVCGGLVGTPCR